MSWLEIAKGQSVEGVCIKHVGQYFCILRSIVLKQFRKTLGLCQTFLLVSQGRSDKTIASSKTIVFSFQKEQFQYFLTNVLLSTTKGPFLDSLVKPSHSCLDTHVVVLPDTHYSVSVLSMLLFIQVGGKQLSCTTCGYKWTTASGISNDIKFTRLT